MSDPVDPWRVRYWAVVAGLTLLHCVLAVITPVSGDEAYYWDCARHFDWSYFDQPPLMLWGIAPFRLLLGDVQLAVRAPAILASVLLACFLAPLLRRLGGDYRHATGACLLLHLTPLIFLGSSYNSTDVGMATAYVAATWAAVSLAQRDARGWWGFGIACGIGFLAKFPVIFVAPALIPALLQRRVREQLKTPTPWLAAALSLLLTAPVWIWGALHEWANILFQLSGRHGRGAGAPLEDFFAFLGGNLGLATPFLLVAFLVAFWRSPWRSEPGWRAFWVAAFAPIVVFGLISLREHVGLHWGAPGLVLGVSAIPLVPFAGRRFWVLFGGIFGLGISLAAVTLAVFPEALLARFWPAGGPEPPGVMGDIIGMDELVAELSTLRHADERVASESYSLVHLIAFTSGGEIPTSLLRLEGRGRHGLASLYWYEPEHYRDADVLYVTERPQLAGDATASFRDCEELAPIVAVRQGHEIRRTHVWRCRGLLDPSVFTRLPGAT